MSMIENDPVVSKAIVASLRIFLDACDRAGRNAKHSEVASIVHAKDPATMALIDAFKLGDVQDD